MLLAGKDVHKELAEIVYEVHLQNMRFTIWHFIRGPVAKMQLGRSCRCICLRWESNTVFCNKIVYCVHVSIVALADLKASTPVAVVVKEKQKHF